MVGVNAVLIWVIFVVLFISVSGVAFVISRGRTSRRNRTSELSLASEVDYQARNDRIPNLEETLKLYAFPQKERFEEGPEGSAPSSTPVSVGN
jgi:hypothetical protein